MKYFTCPSCGANGSFEKENQDFCFCEYCGTKIMLDDYRSTYRFVDEAKIREAELKNEMYLKELEMELKQEELSRKGIKTAFIIALIFVLTGFLLILFEWLMEGMLAITIGAYIALFAFAKGEKDKKKRMKRIQKH
ncbi:hypothetical protein [Floccifex sp.]|uniref:hypothetical protein n=1 Tax=Floccifex sp. TaxID=2815810 RepID=UPI003EFEF2ED